MPGTTAFVIAGLDPAPFAALFGRDEAALKARGVHRITANSVPGYPCRVTLEDAPAGETLLLLNHMSRTDDGPYRASHAIFVREGVDKPAVFENAVPPVMATRALSLRGFDADGMMVDAVLTQPGEAEAGLRHLLRDPKVAEVDVHNAVRGCFSARARRA